MEYTNRHLIEVNCAFQFPSETTEWDSTFFGMFYEQIKNDGFSEREERKGVQIKFDTSIKNSVSPPLTSEIEDVVIFKNNIKGIAIAMGKNKVSFHFIKDYSNWNNFVTTVIKPYSEIYKKLGLGNGMRQCSVIYLNKFIKPVNETLADYFKIITPINAEFGIENVTNIQRVVTNNSSLLVAKLNSQVLQNGYNINFECGAINNNVQGMFNNDWVFQANQTHDPIRSFFESIITEKLRLEL
jgi:uncharacterized protein (TIGR04255 family)